MSGQFFLRTDKPVYRLANDAHFVTLNACIGDDWKMVSIACDHAGHVERDAAVAALRMLSDAFSPGAQP